MANFSVWASEEDIMSIKKAAMAMDRSVSWYLMELHRRNVGSVKPEKPVVVPKENLKPVVQKKAAKPPEAPEPIMGYSETDRSWDVLRKPMPKGGK